MLQIIDNTLTNQATTQGLTLENGEANLESQEVNLIYLSGFAPINQFGGFRIEAREDMPTEFDIANRSARIFNVNGQLGLYYNWDGGITRLFVFGDVPV